MKVQIFLFATFRSYLPPESDGRCAVMELEEGTTVGDVMADLNLPPEIPKKIILNHHHKTDQEILRDGDRLSIFPPMIGG